MSPRSIGLAMATITAFSWAILAIALKYALRDFSSGTIVWVRMIIAFFILLLVFTFKYPKQLVILKAPPKLGLLAGLLIAINYIGFMKGIELTTASYAQIVIQVAPLSFALLSILIYREWPTAMQWLGLFTASLGFGFFYWDQILVSFQQIEQFQLGTFYLLVAAGTWAGFALIQKSLIRTWKPQQFNLLIYGICMILLLPLANFSELDKITWESALLLSFLSLNTVIAYGALSEALGRIPATQVSVILAVNPLLTLAIMTYLTQMEVEWIKGEPIHWRGALGALLVVSGVILTISFAKPLLKTQNSP